jgi:hypothetical protein
MPGALYNVGTVGCCQHGGQIKNAPTQVVVKVLGQPVSTVADQFAIIGCTLNVSGSPHPCTQAVWTGPATMVKVLGQPVILQLSAGTTVAADLTPQGTPVVAANQQVVKGL